MATAKPPSAEQVAQNIRDGLGGSDRHGPGAPIDNEHVKIPGMREFHIDVNGPIDTKGVVNPGQVSATPRRTR